MSHREAKRVRKMYRQAVKQIATKKVSEAIAEKEAYADARAREYAGVAGYWRKVSMVMFGVIMVLAVTVVLLLIMYMG